MANVLAIGNTAADSSDIAVVAGTPVTVYLVTADGSRPPADVNVQLVLVSAGGQYMQVGGLDRFNNALVIDGPGTYRARRLASDGQVGVDAN